MDPGEQIVGQIGLILTQLRQTRRLLEDIERNTARYAGFAVSDALSGGSATKFGAPPLEGNALRVYVVNINDLVPGTGMTGFLGGLLGGIARFFSDTLGGLVGGTLGGLALPYNLLQLARIAEAVDRIMARMATSGGGDSGPSSIGTLLPKITDAVKALTGMFDAGSKGPAENDTPSIARQEWLAILLAISHIVDGLIILVPILIGALLDFLFRLNDIKFAIVDLLQFFLRNALLLRGAILLTVYDTIASAATLGANILSTLGGAMSTIVGSLFAFMGTLLDAAVNVIRFIGPRLKTLMDGLLDWLRDGLGNVLIMLGNTRVFRLIFHLVDILPDMLPALYVIVRSDTAPATLGAADPAALAGVTAARGKAIPGIIGPGFTGAPGTPTRFPDAGSILAPSAATEDLAKQLRGAGGTATAELNTLFNAATGGLRGVAGDMQRQLTTGEDAFNKGLTDRYGVLRDQANVLAGALSGPAAATARPADSGLTAMVKAYEDWITAGGMDTLLGRITEHFRRAPTSGPTAAASLPGQVAAEAIANTPRPRATVEIEDVIIELLPSVPGSTSPTTPWGPGDFEPLHRHYEMQRRRGWDEWQDEEDVA